MKILRNGVLLLSALFLLSACATTIPRSGAGKTYFHSQPGGIPSTKAGFTIIANSSQAKREIVGVFNGYYRIKDLKTVDKQGNTILAVPSLNLLQIGWKRQDDLVFKSEEIVSLQTPGIWRSSFTIPPNYMRIKGARKGGPSAFLYLKPNSRYTLYVKDLRVSGGLLKERAIRFRTSLNDANDERKTHIGTIWADKIIDLPRVKTRGPKKFGVSIIVNPWY